MERKRIDRPSGVVTLMVTGPSGAVALDAWWDQGVRGGVLGIHRMPAEGNGQPYQCEYLDGGLCLPDSSFTAGRNIAPFVSTDLEETAWREVERWYQVHIGGEE